MLETPSSSLTPIYTVYTTGVDDFLSSPVVRSSAGNSLIYPKMTLLMSQGLKEPDPLLGLWSYKQNLHRTKESGLIIKHIRNNCEDLKSIGPGIEAIRKEESWTI